MPQAVFCQLAVVDVQNVTDASHVDTFVDGLEKLRGDLETSALGLMQIIGQSSL
jgi:hypothetical protein